VIAYLHIVLRFRIHGAVRPPHLMPCGMHMDYLLFLVLWLIAMCKCMVSWNSKYGLCPWMSSKTELLCIWN